MNPQERDQLNLFLQQLTQAQAGQKDSEADLLIKDACTRQADSSYLLVQRAMQLEHALQAVKAQADKLQAEIDQMRSGKQSGFLDNAWGRSAQGTAPVAAAAVAAAPAPQPQMMPQAASWGSGILGNVATTAAGVVAGSFLFQGIESLMGHHNGGLGSGLGSGFGGNGNQPQPMTENTVINNYNYADASDDSTGDAGDSGDAGDLSV